MIGNEGISVADALALRGSGTSNNNDGGWGNNGAWWIIVLILLFAGWGRGGYGFGGGDNGGVNPCCAPVTAQGLSSAFNFNQLDNGIRGLEQGMCSGFYTTAQQTNQVLAAIQNCCCENQLGMVQGFNGISQGLASLGFNNQAGFNTLGNQLASCCCDLSRGQENIKYEISNAVNGLLVANDKNTDRIINYLTQTEMDKLRTELQSTQFQLSQLSQTDSIVNRLLPTAKPAYLTCSPYASAFGFGINQLYNGSNCGCTCC